MTANLSSQLTSLTESLKETNHLITRLSTLTSTSTSSAARTELAQDIHDTLKQLEEDLELLQQDAEDLGGSSQAYSLGAGLRSHHNVTTNGGVSGGSNSDKARLETQIARLRTDLRTSRAQFRRAQLRAKKGAEAAKAKERETVFASLQNPSPPASPITATTTTTTTNATTNDLFSGRRTKPLQQKSAQQTELDTATSITASLRRTQALLTTELSRSRFAQETLEQSTAALASLGESYSSLSGVLSNSRELLGTLLRSQKSDTWYLETAFWILCATLGWLIWRRLLLGPFIRVPVFFFRWVLWKPVVGLLYLTGILSAESIQVDSRLAGKGGGRTSLIIQPSAAAAGEIPRFDPEMAEQMRQHGGVPVGAGGRGAKQKPHQQQSEQEPVLEGKMSEAIGKMAANEQDATVEGDDGDSNVEEVRRGDGTVLKDRGENDGPPNPRKTMFEADVEGEEFQGRREQQRGGEKGRDEL